MTDRVAWFITLSAYGNRLHGDDRGSVDRQHNLVGSLMIQPNRGWAEWERNRMNGRPFIFDAPRRAAIEDSVREVCAHRGWMMVACHCRSNHLHLVIATEDDSDRVLHDVKAYTTRGLRKRGLAERDQPVWARHGSVRSLCTDEDVASAATYTLDGQGVDLPGTQVARWHAESHESL